jgi:hypothetical protein
MCRQNFFVLFFVVINILGYSAQETPVSTYENLKVYKFYSGGFSSSQSTTNGKILYKINNKTVRRTKYYRLKRKHDKNWEVIKNCKPCILNIYNKKRKPFSQGIQYGDCGVGWIRYYHPNGKLYISGQYVENTTGDWENIYFRGLCNVKDGIWNFYNTKGEFMYSEHWNAGTFIKQEPEQNKCQIWKVDLLYNDDVYSTQNLTLSDIKRLTIRPYFKSSNQNTNIEYRVTVSALNRKYINLLVSPEELSKLELGTILEENNINASNNPRFTIVVLNDGIVISSFNLNVSF